MIKEKISLGSKLEVENKGLPDDFRTKEGWIDADEKDLGFGRMIYLVFILADKFTFALHETLCFHSG